MVPTSPQPRIAILGLGYVGLPLALAFAKKFPNTIGFDINSQKVAALKSGQDILGEGLEAELNSTSLQMTADEADLKGTDFIIVAVPTPVDGDHRPDLTPVVSACDTVGRIIKSGATVVFESTVYPGLTEEICGPRISKVSGLRQGIDFKLGYSPERINPGDKEHTLETIIKIVSGEDAKTLNLVASVYEAVITAGVHRASSIKVAEAAKVIENTQRDLNIALMNELSLIFDRLNIKTKEVLEAAGTKWNFLRFSPGLVGGHCIGVDPYYLTTKAQQLGYHPEVILAGRRINDGMGVYVAQKIIKLMIQAGMQPKGVRVGVLGITFKENVNDLRNSRVPDIVRELTEFGARVTIHDPHASSEHAQEEYKISLSPWESLKDLDCLVIAVAHSWYTPERLHGLISGLKRPAVVADLKSILPADFSMAGITTWGL